MRMTATITSKGQVTIPGDIRDKMGLAQGDMIVFSTRPGGRCEMRTVKKGQGIEGMLHSCLKRKRPVTIDQMNRDIEAEATGQR